jgi:hypothetical protein
MVKQYHPVKMEDEDYAKMVKAKGAIEAVTGRRFNSMSNAIGEMADFWFKLYATVLSKDVEKMPELKKIAESPLVRKLAEEWVK